MNPANFMVSFPVGVLQTAVVPLYDLTGLAPLTTELLSQNRFEDLHVLLQQGGLPPQHLAECARQLTIDYRHYFPEGLGIRNR